MAQLSASTLAAALVPLLFQSSSVVVTRAVDDAIVIHPHPGANGVQIMIMEIIMSMIFTFFFLIIVYDPELRVYIHEKTNYRNHERMLMHRKRLRGERRSQVSVEDSKPSNINRHRQALPRNLEPGHDILILNNIMAVQDLNYFVVIHYLSGMMVGALLTIVLFVGGSITGGSVNPARVFGPSLIYNEWAYTWSYWVGGILGGLLATAVYHYIYIPTKLHYWKKDVIVHSLCS